MPKYFVCIEAFATLPKPVNRDKIRKLVKQMKEDYACFLVDDLRPIGVEFDRDVKLGTVAISKIEE